MIDSIDTNAAAPAGDADFSSAAPLEAESSADSISATPTSSGLLGEDGSFVPEWYSRFEELKGTEKSLAKFKTPEALARSYTELERLRRYPGVDNEEQMARFRQMAGCLTPKKTTVWNVRKPCRKRNGTLNWRNAWPAPPIATVFLRKP